MPPPSKGGAAGASSSDPAVQTAHNTFRSTAAQRLKRLLSLGLEGGAASSLESPSRPAPTLTDYVRRHTAGRQGAAEGAAGVRWDSRNLLWEVCARFVDQRGSAARSEREPCQVHGAP